MRKNLKCLLLFFFTSFLICISSVQVQAQELMRLREVSGIVKTEKNTWISGASVKIKGTTKGTSTDEKGKFRLLVKPSDTVIVTAIGFTPLEYPCTSTAMSLILQAEDKTLNEVVIGYGKVKKRNITGSISSISAEELAKTPALSFDNAILGKAAGVQVISSSGVPGSATGITIRGLSTLNPDGNQPLIVIDGLPVYGSGRDLNNKTFNASTTPAIGFNGTYVSDDLSSRNEFENNPLASLNPSDIESIEILKDAYATAIYGSRGSAGVILITTKRGTKGKPSFNIQYVTGTVDPIGKYSLLNGEQYNQVYTEYYRQLGLNKTFSSPYNTDWVDEVTRTGISQQLDLSMAAGSDKAQYFISGSYTSQPSYIINNDYERYTGRINFNYDASKSVTVGVNMSLSYTNNSAINAPSIYRNALIKAPNLPVKDENGNYVYDKGSNPYGSMDINPVADAVLNTNRLESTEGIGNIFLQYKPVASLTLRSEFGAELNNSEAYTRRVKRPSGFGNDAVQSTGANKKLVVNNTATFLKTLKSTHYINLMVGQSYEQSSESIVQVGGYNFFSDDIKSISAAGNKYILKAGKQKWALVSYFSRLNYEFKHKYLAGITYRIDGSSKFSSNKRYIGFPSISAGWRISQEKFLKNIKAIDDIKIRGSVGFSGNNSATSYYGSQGQYTLNSNNLSYAGIPILQMSQPENPNLKWERTRSVDVGIDVTLWNNRLTLTADYYERRIKDMVLSSAIPLYQGWTLQPQNIGDMVNKGAELMISGDIIRKKNFTWSSSFNVSTNSNKILKLNFGGEAVGLANDAFKYMKEGEAAGQFYLYDWQGIDPFTGNPMWGDGKGNSSAIPPAALYAQVPDVNVFRHTYGTSLPDFFGGMSHTFIYKSWQLDAFLSFSQGNKMINGSKAALLTYTTEDANNLSTDILNYWLIPGHVTDIPRLVNASVTTAPSTSNGSIRDYTSSLTNSRFLEDGSYIRLRTVSLSYNMNDELLAHMTNRVMRSLKVFVRATNLLTITGYPGLDPEVNAFGSSAIQSGYDRLTMPQNKLVQFGINLGL
jgi:TonB-linked SusC/RagA family outer membrane protein